MEASGAPPGHTPQGSVLVGSEGARRRLVVFEDPQCPYCREFEERCGDLLRREVAAGAVAVEYRIRSFLGNRIGTGGERSGGRRWRWQIRRAASRALRQPAAGTQRRLTTEDLLDLGSRVGLTSVDYVAGVEEGRFESWVREIDQVFEAQDPSGTPFAVLDGRPIDSGSLYDPERLGALIRA